MPRAIQAADNYRDALIKLIPAEIVAAYLMLQANLIGMGEGVIRGTIAVLLVFTYLYLRFLGGVTKRPQLIFSSLSFLVWVYSIAPEPILGDLHNPPLATIILVLWTLIIPFFFKTPPGSAGSSA